MYKYKLDQLAVIYHSTTNNKKYELDMFDKEVTTNTLQTLSDLLLPIYGTAYS